MTDTFFPSNIKSKYDFIHNNKMWCPPSANFKFPPWLHKVGLAPPTTPKTDNGFTRKKKCVFSHKNYYFDFWDLRNFHDSGPYLGPFGSIWIKFEPISKNSSKWMHPPPRYFFLPIVKIIVLYNIKECTVLWPFYWGSKVHYMPIPISPTAEILGIAELRK